MLADAEYIQQILEQGSQGAYQALVERYQSRVFTLCLRIIKNREVAEEVAQDVFVKGFKELAQLKDWNKFPNWLLRIAYSKAIDRVRKKRIIKTEINEVNKQFPVESATPLTAIIKKDNSELIRRAIDQLASEEATVITLYYLEGMAVKEIAELTGLTVSNVKVKLFRARNDLKSIISSLVKKDLNDLI